MFEFETHGDINNLVNMELELLEHLGFGDQQEYCAATYDYSQLAETFKTKILTAEHEELLYKERNIPIAFLTLFPQYTSPFWNMCVVDKDKAAKVDVLLYGMETIGSAERSTNPIEMDELFHTISDGMYAKILYSQFGKERVEKELNDFLSLSFFPRCGGGIGVTRLIRAMKMAGLLPISSYNACTKPSYEGE